MQAVQLERPGGSLIVRTVDIPQVRDGEVLIKMAASPVNPSDLQRIKSVSDENELRTYIPGIEGSGKVIAAGKGFLPHLWLGKRVACSAVHPESGTWAEYMVTSASFCFPLPKSISDEQGSMLLVNPMTALAFFDIISKEKHNAIINSAAAGALGRMIRYIAIKKKILVINVVRNENQVKILHDEGEKYILNSSENDFQNKLHQLSLQINATLALDPVAGSYTGQLLNAIPYGGTVIVYGNLSADTEGPSLRPLVLDNKKLHGFYLGNWMKDNGQIKTMRNLAGVRSLLKNELKITVNQRFPLNLAQFALDTYLNNMTAGKVLLVPTLF